MPLKIDSQLPAYRVLRDEAVPLISEGDAQRQDRALVPPPASAASPLFTKHRFS